MAVVGSCLFLFAIFILCGSNLFTMITLRKVKTINSRTRLFMTNLAIADFLVGLTLIHKFLEHLELAFTEGNAFCALHMFCITLTYNVSLGTMLGKYPPKLTD